MESDESVRTERQLRLHQTTVYETGQKLSILRLATALADRRACQVRVLRTQFLQLFPKNFDQCAGIEPLV